MGVQPNYPADLFAGTADILVYAIDYRKGKEVKNLVAIIDLKTGQIHGWHSAQLGGYNRIFSNGIIANYVLYYDKTNNVCKEKYIEYGEAVKKFEIALNDYRLKNNSSGFELSTIIDEKTLETINHMQLFILKRKEEIEKTQAALEAVKAKIMAAMKDNKVSKFETDKMSVVYIAESERKGVDSEKLKTAYPHIYSEVLKTSKIAENIRIKFK
ncbi:MAG: hypothetical protein LBU09_03415 [Endomicrobium sp.]|nr:hypothetical protein [Endomicrobium sp.]